MSATIAGVPVTEKLVRISIGVWKLSLQNTAGYELPSTGGAGTILIYFVGFTVIVFACFGLLGKRRKNVA